jgi:phage baseplate assembly protein W
MATDFLGRDLRFPIKGKFASVQGIDTVNQDLQILILTIPGERVQRPEYGCRLYTRVWNNLEDIAENGLVDIRDAIRNFEPRVQLLRVNASVDRDRGAVLFTITYNVIGENNPRNLVFPFVRRNT